MELLEDRRSEPEKRRGVSYSALLWCLFGLLLFSPVAQNFGVGERFLNIGLALVLVAAIREESTRRKRVYLALALGVPAVAGRFVTAAWHDPPLVAVVAIFTSTAVFFGYIIRQIMRDVMSGSRVTADKLKGATCVFLLIGMVWSLGYVFLEYLVPGSFSVPAETSATAGELFDSLYYFSFVTLTTLGYGEISPVSHYARTLAMLEAIVGQLYIAIMIARLVGLHAAQGRSEDSN